MLKKEYRIPRIKLVNYQSIATPYFLLRIAKNNLSYCRFRFTVSKKIDKRAVVRNKLRRKISHIIKQMQKRIHGGYDMAFSLRVKALSQKNEVLQASVIEVLEKQQLFV